MYRYIIKRLLQMIPVIFGASFLIFFILNLAPGDVLSYMTQEANLTPEELAELRAYYNLDKPLIVRYLIYMKGLVKGDLGTSYFTGKPVLTSFLQRLPATLKLASSAVLVSMVISIPLGIYSSINRGSLKDNISMVFALLGLSIPNFWLGLMLIIVFALNFSWLPSGGDSGFASLILPAITVGTGLTAALTRTTRSSMLDVIRQDYLRTARAKGASEKSVILKHALKNALIPIITVSGVQLAVALGGSVLTETVFSWPGVGRLIIDSVNARDTPMVVGCITMKTIIIGIVLLVVDLLYAFVDPRIKAQYAKGGKK